MALLLMPATWCWNPRFLICWKGVTLVSSKRPQLVKLAQEGQLMSYIHTGFWQCMDNIREKSMLEKLLAEDKAPWKRWERSVPEIPDYAK